MLKQLLSGLAKGLFPVGLPVKMLKEILSYSIVTTWYVHPNLIGLITLTMFREWYKQWSPSLRSFLHSPFSILFGPNICLRILFLNTHRDGSALHPVIGVCNSTPCLLILATWLVHINLLCYKIPTWRSSQTKTFLRDISCPKSKILPLINVV